MEQTCGTCGGSGKVTVQVQVQDHFEDSRPRTVTIEQTCSSCHGTGQVS